MYTFIDIEIHPRIVDGLIPLTKELLAAVMPFLLTHFFQLLIATCAGPATSPHQLASHPTQEGGFNMVGMAMTKPRRFQFATNVQK